MEAGERLSSRGEGETGLILGGWSEKISLVR